MPSNNNKWIPRDGVTIASTTNTPISNGKIKFNNNNQKKKNEENIFSTWFGACCCYKKNKRAKSGGNNVIRARTRSRSCSVNKKQFEG